MFFISLIFSTFSEEIASEQAKIKTYDFIFFSADSVSFLKQLESVYSSSEIYTNFDLLTSYLIVSIFNFGSNIGDTNSTTKCLPFPSILTSTSSLPPL